ncbi:hypothetical protein BKA70DRAFT_1366255, partial [Coprinopsis sp. MPI-PUGE-AT-0042]
QTVKEAVAQPDGTTKTEEVDHVWPVTVLLFALDIIPLLRQARMGPLVYGISKSRKGCVSIQSIQIQFRQLVSLLSFTLLFSSSLLSPHIPSLCFIVLFLLPRFVFLPSFLHFFISPRFFVVPLFLPKCHSNNLLIPHHVIGSSYTWDEGDQGHKTAKAPWLGVRKLGDEVRPKGWTG